jgi:hypothetical protein
MFNMFVCMHLEEQFALKSLEWNSGISTEKWFNLIF